MIYQFVPYAGKHKNASEDCPGIIRADCCSLCSWVISWHWRSLRCFVQTSKRRFWRYNRFSHPKTEIYL